MSAQEHQELDGMSLMSMKYEINYLLLYNLAIDTILLSKKGNTLTEIKRGQ